jgi:hypothetical protein
MRNRSIITGLSIILIGVGLISVQLCVVNPIQETNIIVDAEFVPGQEIWSFDIPANSKIRVVLKQNITTSDYYFDLVNKFTITVGEQTKVGTIKIKKANPLNFIINPIVYSCHGMAELVFNDTGDATVLELYYGMNEWIYIPEESHDQSLELFLTILLEETWA